MIYFLQFSKHLFSIIVSVRRNEFYSDFFSLIHWLLRICPLFATIYLIYNGSKNLMNLDRPQCIAICSKFKAASLMVKTKTVSLQINM